MRETIEVVSSYVAPRARCAQFTCFTCFTSTKVQILTPEEVVASLYVAPRRGERPRGEAGEVSHSEGGGGKGGQSRRVDLNAAALDELVKAAKVLSLLALLVQKYKY